MTSLRADFSRGIESRFPAIPGFCAFKCGKPLPPRRRKWCSDKCGDAAFWEHNIARGNPGAIRAKVFERDKGVCARCRCDTEAERAEQLKQWRDGKATFPNRHRWEAHHKIAVAEGGGVGPGKDMTLDDFETLCLLCHKKETRELRKRLSKRRDDTTPLLQL